MIESNIPISHIPTTDPLQISWNFCGTLTMYTFTPPNNTSVFYLAVPNFFSEIFLKWIRRRYSTFHNLDPDFWGFFWRPKYIFKCKKRQKINQNCVSGFRPSNRQNPFKKFHFVLFLYIKFLDVEFWQQYYKCKTGQKWSKFDFSKLEFLSRKFD